MKNPKRQNWSVDCHLSKTAIQMTILQKNRAVWELISGWSDQPIRFLLVHTQIHRYTHTQIRRKGLYKVSYLLNKIMSKIDLLVSAIVHDRGGSTGKWCQIDGGRGVSETPMTVVVAQAVGQQWRRWPVTKTTAGGSDNGGGRQQSTRSSSGWGKKQRSWWRQEQSGFSCGSGSSWSMVVVVAMALTTVETDNNQQKAASGAEKTAVVAVAKAEQQRLWWRLQMKCGGGGGGGSSNSRGRQQSKREQHKRQWSRPVDGQPQDS